MKLQKSIELKIQVFKPTFVELVNESHMHSVSKNSQKINETHFKLLLVSDVFKNLSRVQRQRKIYDLLAEEMKGGVHALTMRLLTPEEYSKEQAEFVSPVCHTKNK